MSHKQADAIRRLGQQLRTIAPHLDEERYRPLLALLAIKWERFGRMAAQLGTDLINPETGEFKRSLDTIARTEDGVLRLLAEIGLTPHSADLLKDTKPVIDLEAIRAEFKDANES